MSVFHFSVLSFFFSRLFNQSYVWLLYHSRQLIWMLWRNVCLVWNGVVLSPKVLATVLCFAVQMVDAQKEKNAALTGVVTIACLLVSTESANLANQHRLPALIFTKKMFSTNRIFKIHTQG